jgi:hypothetical protein
MCDAPKKMSDVPQWTRVAHLAPNKNIRCVCGPLHT